MARSLKPGEHNYNFVDMENIRIGHVVVLRRVANSDGNARWLCRCDCGGTTIEHGTYLRAVLKTERTRKRPFCCPHCRHRKV
jgi:hypothetical protein